MIPLWSRQPFGPGNLFASGEQGAWYDPSDINLAWRRNLLTRSEEFDNAAWTKQTATVAANAAIAPDGTMTADALAYPATSATHATFQNANVTSDMAYTQSVYVKANGQNFFNVYGSTGFPSGGYVTFSLVTGTVSSSNLFTGSIVNVGSGWYRCIVTATANSTVAGRLVLRGTPTDTGAGTLYTGDGTSGIFIWGAQLELGSTASAYQRITDGVADYANNVAQPVMYQDSTGATLVSAVEQPVGLILDKSKGVVIGPELVTNGDFSNGSTGWTPETGWAVSGGAAVATAAAAFNSLTQSAFPFVAGRLYKVTFQIVSVSAGGARINFAGGTQVSTSTYSAAGTYTEHVFAQTGNTQLRIQAGAAGFTGSVDNISVKELAGNHAFQATPSSRPVLSARYNLLTYSEQFDNAAWVKANTTVAANSTTAPDGTTTADTLTANAGTGGREIYQNATLTAGVSYVMSIVARKSTHDFIQLRHYTGAGGATRFANFDIATGAVGTVGADATASIQSLGGGWYRCSMTAAPTATASGIDLFMVPAATSASGASLTATGTEAVFLWGADLRVTNDALRIPAYQRIAAATDYDTTGFLPYLRFDGVDDSLATNSIDFTTATIGPRRNRFTFPQDFDNAAWVKDGTTVSANTTTAPDGTTTADTVIASATLGVHAVRQDPGTTGPVTVSVYAKAGTHNFLQIFHGASANLFANFDLSTGALGTAGSTTTASIESAGSGWYRCIISVTVASSSAIRFALVSSASAAYNQSWTAAGTETVFLWGAQLEAGALLETGSTASAYQPVGTDKMTVFAGVRKLSDAARGMLVELSSTFSNPGVFQINAPNATATYDFSSGGSTGAVAVATATSLAAPTSNALTGIGNISGDVATIRANGVQAATSSTDQGNGLYGNYPLFIGRRNNATLPFNGRLYNLIVRGAQTDASTITVTENYINQKTGAY